MYKHRSGGIRTAAHAADIMSWLKSENGLIKTFQRGSFPHFFTFPLCIQVSIINSIGLKCAPVYVCVGMGKVRLEWELNKHAMVKAKWNFEFCTEKINKSKREMEMGTTTVTGSAYTQ